MAEYINVGDTIEGNRVSCVARKFVRGALKKHPLTCKTMLLVTADRNSSTEVLKRCTVKYDENIESLTKDFHREVGDILKADSISIYIDARVCPKIKNTEGVTGRHGANFMTTDTHTIATVKMPLENMKRVLGFSNNDPKKIK